MLSEDSDDMQFDSWDKADHKAHKAHQLYEQGMMNQALSELDSALSINPISGALHFNKALTLDAMNRFEDAINEYKTALDFNQEDIEAINSLAIDYTRTAHYDLSIDLFEKIQQLKPDFEPCYCNRIITYTEMGKHDLAEQMFYLAQQINPDCPLCYYNIGNSLFARGLYQKAILCWEKAATLEPHHPQINYRIAQARWANGDFNIAYKQFLAELRKNPGDIEVILEFGLFLLERGQIDSAKEKFNRILEFDPGCAPAIFYLGEIAFNHGEFEKAMELFTLALSKDDGLVGIRYRMAQYAMLAGQNKKAIDLLSLELELNPDDPDVLLSMGLMFLELGDLNYATTCFLRVNNEDENNADAQHYLGLVVAMEGNYHDALDFFECALKNRPDDVLILTNCALAHLGICELAKAQEKIKHILSLNSDDRLVRTLNRNIKFLLFCQRLGKAVQTFFGRFKKTRPGR